MNKYVVVLAFSILLGACTSVQVEPINADLQLRKICIEENPKVIVGDFLSTVRNRIEYHGIDTDVSSRPDPNQCEYIMTYTARQTWDIATYLHHAELRLERHGRRVGYAEYRLKGKGGLTLNKWKSTKKKMDPVIDALLRM